VEVDEAEDERGLRDVDPVFEDEWEEDCWCDEAEAEGDDDDWAEMEEAAVDDEDFPGCWRDVEDDEEDDSDDSFGSAMLDRSRSPSEVEACCCWTRSSAAIVLCMRIAMRSAGGAEIGNWQWIGG